MMKLLDTLPKGYVTETLGKQLLRSATSVGANVAEAQSASSRRDFINGYTHALKSANESKFWLGLLKDSGRASAEPVDGLLQESREISNILAASILTLKGKRS